jgi:NAD(P)H-nitrite reductase large subunit
MGEISKAAYLMQAFDRESPLPEERLALLFDLNTPSVAVSVADMPGEMQVCNCNGVSKAAICAAVSAGQNDVRGVMTATRAGMGCGSCKGQIGDIVNWFLSQAPAEPEPAEADNVFVLRPVRADGHCTPAQLMRIAEVANEYDVPVKFLGADRIEFVGLPSEAVLRLRGELFASAAE